MTIFEIMLAFTLYMIIKSDKKPFYYLLIFPCIDNAFDYIMLISIKIEEHRQGNSSRKNSKLFIIHLWNQIFKTIFIINAYAHSAKLRDNPDHKNWSIIVFSVILTIWDIIIH